MRKIGIAAALVLITLLIALAVRGQLRPTPPADAATDSPAGADTSVLPATAGQPAADTPFAREQIRKITEMAPPMPSHSTPPRPVVSGNVPTVAEDNQAAPQDGAAVLRRAAAAYGKLRSMRAQFVQHRENPLLNSSTDARGTLYQRDPDRFALKFSDPAGDVIVGDGTYFWLYYPSVDKRQVLRSPARQGAGAVDLKSQFIGDPLSRFSYVYHGTERLAGRTVHVLTLTPRQNVGYQTLKVWVDGSDYLVRRFQITEPTGVQMEFQLSNLAVNPTLGDEIFRFTPPAGTTVIER